MDSEHEHHGSNAHYVFIWVLLLGLTTLTFFVTPIVPKALHVPTAIVIGTLKATLVVLFFMHLRGGDPASQFTLLISLGFVVALIVFVLGDVYSRFPPTNPNQSPLAGASLVERTRLFDEAVAGPKPVPSEARH